MEESKRRAAVSRGVSGEPMDGETREQAFKRRNVPYEQMDPETKIEFETSAMIGDIWNDDWDLETTDEDDEELFADVTAMLEANKTQK